MSMAMLSLFASVILTLVAFALSAHDGGDFSSA
jgi:heme/copper-type cytochrome/quinol oxidase subunit 4